MATQAGVDAAVRGGKFELYMWFFTRVSGILMLLMGAYSIIYANLMGGRGTMDAGRADALGVLSHLVSRGRHRRGADA